MRRACSTPARCFPSCIAAPNSAACMCMPARLRFRASHVFEGDCEDTDAMTTMRGVVLTALIALMAAPALAGPFEDAETALQRDDYAAALELLRPLAAGGHTAAQANLGMLYQFGR